MGRAWTLRQLAQRAGVSLSGARGVEAGQRASLEMYARLGHALGLRLEVEFSDARRGRVGGSRDADPVHAAMGEFEAAHLGALGFEVAIDEPYQHYQFAGRADVLAWSRHARTLLHIENRTRFPNVQEVAGSYNAKRAYLAAVIADRLAVRGGFANVTHVMAALWSAEVLHAIRLRRATFAALCPDPTDPFDAWWAGRQPDHPRSSALVLLDPFARPRQRLWVGLAALDGAPPRMRGYREAAGLLRSRGG